MINKKKVIIAGAIANGIVTPNADASDYGSVILPGGASSRDYVRR